MVVPSERNLRDQLARNLGLIEPGLRLHSAEYPLPNSHGTKGFIDLLARDRHGMWVVIELKRGRGPDRQALHEVAKYAELLSRERSLPSREIRTVIVSIDWDELLVPVSNMARDWLHDLRGYRLITDDAGRP
jgi:RecB family endonuclease NucS